MFRHFASPLLLCGLLACQSQPTEKATTLPAATPDDTAATSPAAPDTSHAPAVAPAAAPPPVDSAAGWARQTLTAPYPYTVPPIDQTRREPALRTFIEQVLSACARQDQRALLALVDDRVAVSMGGGLYGKEDFVSDFLNNTTKGSGFAQFQHMIRLGGTVKRDSTGRPYAIFPYLQDADRYSPPVQQLDLEPFITFVGTTANVVVYERPRRSSRPLRRLRYPVLFGPLDDPHLPEPWLLVTAADSSFRGYVDYRQLYCLADVTLTIKQKNGRYRITSVIPYD